MQAKVFAGTGEEAGTTSLPEEIFGGPVRKHLLHEVIQGYLANQRQGTAKVKSRAEVRGGGRKPWRQKGTGRARAGTIRSAIWVGGGRAFGPKPRSYNVHLNRRMKRQALRSALTAKARDDGVSVVNELTLPEAKTKLAHQVLKRMGLEGQKCLLVVDGHNPTVLRATRNIPRFYVTTWQSLNAYDVLNCQRILFTKEALDKLVEANKA
jgi:large subunit ribosomal protein L4